MNFAELRASIETMSSMTYLNTGWEGPTPPRIVERMREAASRESALGPAGPDGQAYAAEIEREAKEGAAKLLNVNADDLLLTHGTTEGVNIVLHGLAWEPGDTLLTCDLEHPGIRTPSAVLGDRRGVDVRTVSLPPNPTADQCLTAVTDALNPSVKIVALSHIMFTCGLRIPAEEIVEAAHDAGALVLLDGAQTPGHIQLDLAAMGVDYYACSGQKWLLGPTGSGVLYARPASRRLLTPMLNGEGLDHRSGWSLFPLASQGVVVRAGYAEALNLYHELGPENVQAHTHTLASRLRTGFSEIAGVTINGPTDGPTSSAITAISVDGWQPADFVEALWTKHRVVARHVPNPAGIRFCTASCNDATDVDAALEAVRDLVG